MKRVRRLLELLWIATLGIALIVSALSTDRRARQVEENPSFCDPFGYLQMADDIRRAAASRTAPQFVIETPHTRLLVELMQSQKQPVPLWDEMVAPLAFHYFPAADHVAAQYPPGAGLLLSLFPEGRALHGLNRMVVVIFLMAGLGMLVVAAIKRRPIAASFLVLALILGLEIVAQLDNASFSMNSLLAPLLLSGLCLSAAWALGSDNSKRFYLAWLLTLLAGLFLGFAILARIPVVLLLPGVFLLLWPVSLRTLHKSPWIPFGLGVFLGGILPLMIHQSRVAGAWYLTTYAHENTEPPTLDRVMDNISYYYGPGRSSSVNWGITALFIGLVGLLLWSQRRVGIGAPAKFLRRVSWTRLIASAAVVLAVSNVYFLTHVARVHYYTWPAMFGAVLMLALGAFALENNPAATTQSTGWLRRSLMLFGLFLALAPAVVVMGRVWSHYEPPSGETPRKQFSIPAELADESAWVWACQLSGTFWYYGRKPTHKVTSTNAEIRELVFKFVQRRGEPQFIVNDDPSMQAVLDEIVQLGGKLEPRGAVDNYPYYLIHWAPK
ncbi:MAG TPA: hypothetical protein VMS31_06090 [Pyrinomonadaceae bacterium]|nr:hypothetical protein [Pyrinomonadaceae bacterium]